ncbi:MAG TPA: ribosome maturation factor RimP [Candidatus Binatia bacterium]|nr:ribosome maturation factor RimP [Candidatus Binatia bacterium]
MDTSVAQRVWSLAEPLAQQEGLEIVDTEYRHEGRGTVLRVYLDRAGGGPLGPGHAGGVTLDELTRFSRLLGDVLEVHQAVPGSYTLEASSPGVNRRLRVPEQFARFLGHRVRVRTVEPVNGRRMFVGVLREVHADGIVLGDLPGDQAIRFGDVAQANYEHDFALPKVRR